MRRASVLLAVIVLLLAPTAVLAQEEFTAELSGDAEVPPVETEGTGSGTFTISDDETSIDYQVDFEGLSGPPSAGAHIHIGGEDEAGPPVLNIDVSGATGTDGTLSGTLTEADILPDVTQTFAEILAEIRAGNSYVNLHTEDNPGGEIRGQLTAQAGASPDASPAETPAAETPAAGEESPTPPSTSTVEPEVAVGSSPIALVLLALAGLAIFMVVLQRLQARRS